MYNSTVRLLGLWLFLAAVYFAAGRFGLLFAFTNSSVTLIWPPTGIAVAALFVFGRKAWVGITLGAFLVNLNPSGQLTPFPFIAAAGNTLEALVAVEILRRFAFDRDMTRMRDLGILAGASVAVVISASLGVLGLALSNSLIPANTGTVFLQWIGGDLVGLLVFAPPLMTFRREHYATLRPRVVWLATAALVAVWLLLNSQISVLFVILALIIFTAFRSKNAHYVSVMILSIALLSIISATTNPENIFNMRGNGVLTLWIFLFTAVFAGLGFHEMIAVTRNSHVQ